jgi:hypothetical protein
MKVTQEQFDVIQAWIMAVESGLADDATWSPWAMAEIERTVGPVDPWLTDLYLSSSRERALDVLYEATKRAPNGLEWFHKLSYAVGLLYLRYLGGEITLEQLISKAGDETDSLNGSDPPCETYYGLLGELRTGPPNWRSREQLEQAVAKWMGPSTAVARSILSRIPVKLPPSVP